MLLLGGGVYEPEALALFARMAVQPSAPRKALISDTIKALKAAGAWAKDDALYFTAAHDAQAARLNWISDQYNLTVVGSPTFTVDRGYTGDGSAAYLRTGFNPTTAVSPKFARDSAHISLTDRTSRAAAATVEMGAIAITGLNFSAELATRYTGNLTRARVTSGGTSPPAFASSDSAGRFLVSRTGASQIDGYRNGSSIGTSSNASAALLNSEIYILAVNFNGAASFSYDQIAHASIGGGLTSSEASAFDAIVATYLSAIGA
ncbi:hypothetical protein [Ancylobacter polymorphus]|uniref:Uncharacterized protein n=1 Tax=Ancylobacter polymorphus TaxID=223390 RepID=A0ABU0BJZ2_9HYPH|nr:hypothetical protein [Ancylobacter polymorphus]MDQ0305347.1 hypothetical protein [Ancylobacter polymorphus]